MRRPGPVLALLTLVAALTACSGNDQSPPAPTPSTPEVTTEEEGPDTEPVVTVSVPADGTEIELGIHPLVRAGEYVVLTLDATPGALADGARTQLTNVFSRVNTFTLPIESPLPVRLLDLERGVVMHGGTDDDEDPVVAPRAWAQIDSDAGTRLQMAFAAPPTDVTSLAMLVPGAPFIEAVPVIDGEVPPSIRPGTESDSGDEPEVLDLDAISVARTFPLESTSRELAGAVQTTESTEKIEVTLGSDVLFAFDSAELTAQADEAVALVAERVNAREPGPVTVIGHTDDQGDAPYNQDLSERRAQAVAGALAAHVDVAAYPLEVQGKGMSEPLVQNNSEENRARNRRVTVGLTSTVVTRTEAVTSGELPPWEGPVGDAGTPLRLDEPPGGVWDVDATARRVHGHVVLDLAVTAVEDGYTSFLRSLSSHRGVQTTAPHSSGAGLTVLHGATRLHPLDYRSGESEGAPGGEWLLAADLIADVSYDAGQTYVFTYVYPRLDVDTVTIQIGSTGRLANDFRLVDIPVRD